MNSDLKKREKDYKKNIEIRRRSDGMGISRGNTDCLFLHKLHYWQNSQA